MANKTKKFPGEVYDKSTLQKIMDTFGNSATDIRNRALVMVYVRAQLRCAEALDLCVHDKDFTRGAITVRNGKGSKRRVVGIDTETLGRISQWVAVRPDKGFVLFSSHKGTRLCNSYVRRLVKTIARKAGIKQRVHVHGFRHTGACHLAEAGVDIRVIQRQLGHSNLAITTRYLDHISANDVVDAMQKLNW